MSQTPPLPPTSPPWCIDHAALHTLQSLHTVDPAVIVAFCGRRVLPETLPLVYIRDVFRGTHKGSQKSTALGQPHASGTRRVLLMTKQSIFICSEESEVKRMIPVTAVTEIHRYTQVAPDRNEPSLLLIVPSDHDLFLTFCNEGQHRPATSMESFVRIIQLIHKAWTSRTIPDRLSPTPAPPLRLKKPFVTHGQQVEMLAKLCAAHKPPPITAPPPPPPPPPTFELVASSVVPDPPDPGLTISHSRVTSKPAAVVDALSLIMVTCHLFEHWSPEELELAIDAMTEVVYRRGAIIMNQSAPAAPHAFHILKRGHVSVLMGDHLVNVLKPGSFFGERNVMFARSSTDATLRVDDASCTCYSLSSSSFRQITIFELDHQKRDWYEDDFLENNGWMMGVTAAERLTLVDALQPMAHADGESLIEYGARGDSMFFILSGVVDVVGKNVAGELIHVCSLTAGDTIGDFEFVNNLMTLADVSARGQVTAARLSREHFDVILGRVLTLMRRGDVARPPHVPELDDYYAEHMPHLA